MSDIDVDASEYATPQEVYGEAPSPVESVSSTPELADAVSPYATEAAEDTETEIGETLEDAPEAAEVPDDDVDVDAQDEADGSVEEPEEAGEEFDLMSAVVDVTVDGVAGKKTVAELTKDYELRKASYDRLEEAAGMRKQVEQAYQQLQDQVNEVFGPQANVDSQLQFLQNQGVDVWNLVERHVAMNGMDVQQVAERLGRIEVMSPQERRAAMLMQQAEERMREINAKEAEAAAERARVEAEFQEKRLALSIDQALESSGLPATPETRYEVVTFLQRFAPEGKEISETLIQAAAAEVAKSVPERVNRTLGSLDAESLVAQLGEENVKKIQEHLVQKASKGRKKVKKASPVKAKPTRPGGGDVTYLEDIEF